MDTETIKNMIATGNTEEALRLLNEYITSNSTSDEAYFLRGNAYQKRGEIRLAINNYLSAMELNADSPAHQAYNLLIKVMNFYNKDMFNH